MNIYSAYPKYNLKRVRALRLSIIFRGTLHVSYLRSITPRFWEEILPSLLPGCIKSHQRIPAGVTDGESTSAETRDLLTPLVIIATRLIDRLLSVCLFSPVRTSVVAQKRSADGVGRCPTVTEVIKMQKSFNPQVFVYSSMKLKLLLNHGLTWGEVIEYTSVSTFRV